MTSTELIILGLLGQFLYFLRFFIQWYYTEKHKRITVPTSFWIISILGAIMLFIYAYIRQDIVFIIGSILALLIYSRNLIIDIRGRRSEGNELGRDLEK